MTNMDAGFKRPLDRQPLSRFRGRNASVILLSFYCISLVLIKSVLIKPVLIKSFEMKRPFMVWIGFISICCSKVAKEGKSYPWLLVLQRVAQNTKSCSKVAEHNLFMPTHGRNENSMNRKQVQIERKRAIACCTTKHDIRHAVWDLVGTLRCNDATATRTSKTTTGLEGKTKTLRVHLTFFVHFFAIFARLRVEIACEFA